MKGLYMSISYTIFKTNLGWCGLVGGKRGLLEIILPMSQKTMVNKYITSKYQAAKINDEYFIQLIEKLIRYFKGENVSLYFSLDLSGTTSFQKKVWKKTQIIPYGEVRTYGWISEEMGSGKAARAVGQALGRNPFPILIPCHRVVKGNGEMGGFSNGIDLKKRLLKLEGIQITREGKVIRKS
ncbi:MAG: methylated-DNA--[protein]-cysteine S-methyltransferase [Thermodesulfobacteriota bacterium]|nr:methylated-DNA--[protein]-cysteine S-methyltransferase [Thermodesulfobacteriota bacterium]